MSAFPGPARRVETVADLEALHRVQRVAAGLAVVFVATWLLRGRFTGGIVLTASTLVSIVGFRSLVGVVRRLEVEAGGGMTKAGARRFLLRWVLLTVAITIAIILGSRDALALFLGLSVVPLAVIAEAAGQLLGLGRRRDR